MVFEIKRICLTNHGLTQFIDHSSANRVGRGFIEITFPNSFSVRGKTDFVVPIKWVQDVSVDAGG